MPANASVSNDITYIDWITQSNFWDYNTYINNDIKYIDWITQTDFLGYRGEFGKINLIMSMSKMQQKNTNRLKM